MKIVWGLIFSFLAASANAQYTQQLRGTVTDQVLQKPLSFATVTVTEINKTVTADADGVFHFGALPIGLYHLKVSHAGFKEAVLENISVNAGKETVLTIALEAMVVAETEVIIKSNSKKNKPLNDMSVVSARAFTVEETQKYAAAVNDPLRMATAFPGVIAGNDGGNSIIIRGNSSTGLLWKMEGMDIPNPNHFSYAGNSGGGISILSSQLLANSDFVTAAFASEYGNALSGVFDLKLRKGNNEKREYTLQAGVLGLNVAVEGPFSKSYKGSYLVNYRYSTLQLLNKIGVLPGNVATNFQDLSYNIYLPAKKAGVFSFLGFNGLSTDDGAEKYDSSKWVTRDDRYPYNFVANTLFNGITHTISLGSKATLKSGLGISYTKNSYDEQFIKADYVKVQSYKDNYVTKKKSFNSTLNYKFNNRLNVKAGIILNFIDFNYYQRSAEHLGEPLQERINTTGNTTTTQAFAQWQYRAGDKLSVTAGLHYLNLALNNSSSIEPRVAAKYIINSKSSIAAGYGQHSQLQVMGVYLAQLQNSNGDTYKPNKNLGFTRARHFVLSYNYRLAKNLQLKTEVYYQQLFNVPVSTKPGSTFSTLNIIDGYVLEPLINKGKGKNYGMEISAERYLNNNFYLTLTNSFYQSKYTALDGIERNTKFNGNYITTFIAGKDFVNVNRHRTFGINVKTIYAGGLRNTPIDFAASRASGYGVYKDAEAFSLQNPAYFRTDLKVSMKWNKKHLTSTLSLDIQNVSNRLNIYNQSFDETTGKLETNYQSGIIPILNYKVEF